MTRDASRNVSQLILAALVSGAIVFKLLLAWRFDGFLTGDDLEIVETAGKYAWGLVYQPWSLRSLFHPLLLVFPVVRLAAALHVTDPHVLSWIAVIPHAIVSSINIVLVYLLARTWRCARWTSLAASFLYAIHWLPLGYGSMTYPRPISTCMILLALLLILRRQTPLAHVAAGLLIGSAFAIRFSEGVILVPILAIAFARRQRLQEPIQVAIGALVGIVLFVGVFDQVTWGSPFFSLREFFRIMYMNPPPAFPHSDNPWYWYATSILQWAGPIPVLLALAAVRDRRARPALFMTLCVIVLMSGFRYKTFRYLQAAIPFLCIAAAVGVARLWDDPRIGRRLGITAIAISIPYGFTRTLSLLRGKSQAAVAAIRTIEPTGPRILVLEQSWAYGDRLYVSDATQIRDVPPSRPLPPEALAPLLPGADWVGLYAKDLQPAMTRLLAAAGYRPAGRFSRDESLTVMLFRSDRH